MKITSLRDYLPIAGIQDDIILSKRGDLTFGWRIILPVAYSVNESGYDGIIASFFRAYRSLPPYCIVHKQDVFRYDTYHAGKKEEFLADCYEKHFDGRQYLNGYCYIFLTFSSKGVIEAKTSSAPHSGVVKAPDEKRVRECASAASVFEGILKTNPLISISRLTSDDFLHPGLYGEDCGIVADYLSFYKDGPHIDYGLDFYQDRIECNDKEARVWYIQDSDAYPSQVASVRPVQSMSTASTQVFLSGGSPIGYDLKFPHIVNRYVVTLPSKTVEKELDQKQRLMNSFSLYSAGCAVNSQEIAEYLILNQKEAQTTVKCFTDIIAWGEPSQMEDIRTAIISAGSTLSITFSEERRLAPALHYAAIPGAAGELGAEFLMTSEMTAFLCHGLWDGYDFGIKGGSVQFCDRQRKVPISLDIASVAQKHGLINAMNGFIIGPTGSGKSYAMNKLVESCHNNGDFSVIIDRGNSYIGLCRIIAEETDGKSGRYIACDPGHLIGFNPFREWKHWNDVDENGEMERSGMQFIMALLTSLYIPDKGWKTESKAVLQNMVEEFLRLWADGYDHSLEDRLREAFVNEKRRRAERTKRKFEEEDAMVGWRNPLPTVFPEGRKEDPLFDDFYNFVASVVSPLTKDENWFIDSSVVRPDMFDVDSFVVAISKFKKSGQYGYLLNSEETEDIFSSKTTVIEVDKISDNEDIFPIWMLCIIHNFEEKMFTLKCHKNLIIEEAWSAIARPSMADFIAWLWRTARKHDAAAWVVTQSLSDLVSSSIIRDAIILNSEVKILLDQSQSKNDPEVMVNTLGLSPTALTQVLSLNTNLSQEYQKKHVKEIFIALGNSYSNVFANETSLEEAIVFESKANKREVVFKMADELGSYRKAVETVADRIRKGTMEW